MLLVIYLLWQRVKNIRCIEFIYFPEFIFVCIFYVSSSTQAVREEVSTGHVSQASIYLMEASIPFSAFEHFIN